MVPDRRPPLPAKRKAWLYIGRRRSVPSGVDLPLCVILNIHFNA